jgi:hypothetical protein
MEKNRTYFEELVKEKANVKQCLSNEIEWVTDLKEYFIIIDKEIELHKP